MTSLDELRSFALDLAQTGVAKAKELTDIAKLNINNSTEEETIRRAYIELGKLYYAERGMAPEGAYVTLCEKITAAKTRIEDNRAKMNDIKASGTCCDADSCDCGCGGADTEVPPEEPVTHREEPIVHIVEPEDKD